jgi:DNA-binding transcriptional regulator LsrR (DeoR family)
MGNKNVSAILYDHNESGLGYRSLAEKYGITRDQVHRIVMSKHNKQRKAKEIVPEIKVELPLPDDINLLKKELREAHLLIELQGFMLDISSKELGIDLRKKHGTRQSK